MQCTMHTIEYYARTTIILQLHYVNFYWPLPYIWHKDVNFLHVCTIHPTVQFANLHIKFERSQASFWDITLHIIIKITQIVLYMGAYFSSAFLLFLLLPPLLPLLPPPLLHKSNRLPLDMQSTTWYAPNLNTNA